MDGGIHHAPISLGTNTASALSLVGQKLSLGDVFVQIAGDTMTGDLIVQRDALGASFVDTTGVIRLKNATAATATVAQLSPALIFEGYGYKTGAGAGSKKSEAAILVVPKIISLNGAIAQTLSFFNSNEDETYLENLRLGITRGGLLYNTISGDGTFVDTVYPWSIQTSGTNCYMEILNGGGTGKGAFFGINGAGADGDAFELYNYQGGAIDFYTDTATSSSILRFRIKNSGEVQVQQGLTASELANVGGVDTDFFTDANNGTTVETDLYTRTLPASTLGTNGDKIAATYQGIFTGAAAATQQLKVYFGGTAIYDSGALSIGAATNQWTVEVLVIRVSSSVVRCSVSVNSDFATLFPYSKYTEVTGLTLANTQIIKITGTAAGASGASNQITAKCGSISWHPHA